MVETIPISRIGIHHRGRRATSAKALPGEKKTPVSRSTSLRLCGNGGGKGGGAVSDWGFIMRFYICSATRMNGFGILKHGEAGHRRNHSLSHSAVRLGWAARRLGFVARH